MLLFLYALANGSWSRPARFLNILAFVGENQWLIYVFHHILIDILDSSFSMESADAMEVAVYATGLVSVVVAAPVAFAHMIFMSTNRVKACVAAMRARDPVSPALL